MLYTRTLKMCALHSLLFISFAKLDLIEVNESMKLKGSEMGTKMQKIESRRQLLQARKLWKITTSCGARGPSPDPTWPAPEAAAASISSGEAVDAAVSGLFLSFKAESSVERTFDRGRPPFLLTVAAILPTLA